MDADLKKEILELKDQLEHLNAISSAKEKILLSYIKEADDLYKELSKKVHEIKEKNKAVDEARAIMSQNERLFTLGIMAAALSHEIKNPIIAIIGLVNRLLSQVTNKDKEYLEVIKKEAMRIEGIISRLSDYYKFKQTKKELNNINNLIKETIELTGHYLSRFKKVDTVIELADDIPEFYFNKGQIQQVLVNLIMNASQAMLYGGKLSIRTKLLKGNDNLQSKVIIEVEDTGTGISPENMPKIFLPFFSTKSATEGTGIGLSISKEIIERHGGEIFAESEVGVGSTFTIILPFIIDEYCDTKQN